MLKILMLMKLEALKSWINGSTRKKKAASKGSLIGFTCLMLYALGSLGFLFFHIFETVGEPLHAFGLGWLYFVLTASFSFGLMFIGCTFTAKAQLFEAHDNDLMLSLPLKGSDILISRLFMLAVINLVLGLLVYVPSAVVWTRICGLSAVSLICTVFSLIFVLAFALAVSSLFGWLIHIAVARIPGNKAAITTVFSLMLVGAYMYVNFNMNNMLTTLASDPSGAAGLFSAIKPIYLLGKASAEGSFSSLLLAGIIPAAAFALMYTVLSRTFLQAATVSTVEAKRHYVAKQAVQLSPSRALLQRELDRFFSCSAYIMNAGFGVVAAPVAAVALLLKREVILSLTAIPEIGRLLTPLMILAMCLMASMTVITAPSISLEGKNLWICRSLPVSSGDILLAKLKLHCIMGMPSMLILCAAMVYILSPSPLMSVLVFLVPLAAVFFSGVVGLYFGIKLPNLDWTNETQAVKSSMGALATIGICWGAFALPAIIYLVSDAAISANAILVIFTVLLCAADLLLFRLTMVKGAAMFEEI